MIYFIFAILGLIVGSFLNAVIFRLKIEKSFVRGRSECMHCHHALSGWDLVPIFSYMYLKGRCRYCHKKLSWQYPVIEGLTAFLFVLSMVQFGLTLTLLGTLVFLCWLVVIGTYDLKYFLILDKVLLPASVLALAKNIVMDLTKPQAIWDVRSFTLDGIFAAVIISGFFAIQYYFSKGKWIGFGDVKLGVFLGFLFGVKLGVLVLILGYFVGAVTGLALIAMGKKHMGSKLPLGSFLAISAIIVLLYGRQIADWYLRLIGF